MVEFRGEQHHPALGGAVAHLPFHAKAVGDRGEAGLQRLQFDREIGGGEKAALLLHVGGNARGDIAAVERVAHRFGSDTERSLESLDRVLSPLHMRVVTREQAHLGAGLFDDPSDVLGRVRRGAYLALHVLARPERQRLQPFLALSLSAAGVLGQFGTQVLAGSVGPVRAGTAVKIRCVPSGTRSSPARRITRSARTTVGSSLVV